MQQHRTLGVLMQGRMTPKAYVLHQHYINLSSSTGKRANHQRVILQLEQLNSRLLTRSTEGHRESRSSGKMFHSLPKGKYVHSQTLVGERDGES